MRSMTRRVLDQVVVIANEFLERERALRAVEHRSKRADTKLLAEPISVDPIALVAVSVPTARVAHNDALGVDCLTDSVLFFISIS